ncbi:MAG TPA: hypothetical protein DCR55_04915 [Lentisphaeria bacterium]|jgi:putative transcriptional regulator|nr:hypothetical protein [Lentisphaeria bacterium]
MKRWEFSLPPTAQKLETGTLLVATPALAGSFFAKSLILLCEHDAGGSFGLVLNNRLPVMLSDAIDGLDDWDVSVFQGGPVQPHTLHFLHRAPDAAVEGKEVADGIFWGGSMTDMLREVKLGHVNPNDIRFMVGYTGWGEEQLASEMEDESWFLLPATSDLIFESDTDKQWSTALRAMGPAHAVFSNFPDDPRCN